MASLPSFINRFSIVKRLPLFAQLNWLELHRIARHTTIVEYTKGEMICKEGTPADGFYCLISGRVMAYIHGPGRQKDQVEFIHRGMPFGIISALTGENHSHNFEAINDSVVLRIDRHEFADILKATPQLGVELSQSLSRRIRRQVTQSHEGPNCTIISVYSPMKGAGSSTYAINLALSLEKETNKKVLFINLESSEELNEADQAEPVETAPSWKERPVKLQDIVDNHEQIMATISKGDMKIDVLNAFFDSSDDTLVHKMSHFVSAPVDDYHYIVVDLPNQVDNLVIQTLTQSDLIHLVAVDQERDLEVTRTVIDKLQERLKENFKEEKVKVVVSGVQSKSNLTYEEIRKILNFDVFVNLPHIKRSELSTAVVSRGMTVITCDPASEYAQAVTRIARKIGGVLVGLVLGGGAALGLAHVGVLRILERENIPIDIVIGSSMGALVGAMWAVGKKSDELEVIAREFESKMALLNLFDPIFPLRGLVGGRAIRQWLKKHLGSNTFHNTKLPFKVIAYDLWRREDLILEKGSLVDAVCKSIAIPGVIAPIIEGDQIIIDGGVLNPLPTNVLADLGVKRIIAVNVLQSPQHVSEGNELAKKLEQARSQITFMKDPRRYIGFRISSFFGRAMTPNISDIIVRTLQASEYVIAEQSARKADVVIHPNLAGINWFELYKVGELIRLGEQAAIAQLPAMKELVKE